MLFRTGIFGDIANMPGMFLHCKAGIVSKETDAASVGNCNTINWDNQTN